MLTDTSFYTDHSSLKWVDGDTDHSILKWVDGDIDAEHLQLEQSHVDAVCFLTCLQSTSEADAYALVNFELNRLCTLPPLGDLPFGNFNDFDHAGFEEGLLLLERAEGIHGDDSVLDKYELDRFLFNPLSKWFMKLPDVPKNKGNAEDHLRMFMAVEKEIVTVVAVGFHSFWRTEFPRILIWHQGSQDWVQINVFDPPSPILPVDNPVFSSLTTNVVYVGGELFLHVGTHEGVLGDILFIRNVDEPSVFILCNFQTKQWCRYYAKDLVHADTSADSYHVISLWSPKRYDSRQIAPSVR
ncbi:hypothetical protein R1sor_003252 [Riccia sorocarpa]|uniref:F-box protein n=1 Tax=Riccia sorocarpa TaxID=122646 RepID=A0ABD3H120_9MARC